MTSIRTMMAFALAGCLVLGCGGFGDGPDARPKSKKEQAEKDKDKKKHDHPDEGPHGGPLADWNDEYHAEFTVDHKTKTARVFIYGPDAKTPVAIDAKVVKLSLKRPVVQIELKPERQKDDPEGKASLFVGTHEALAKEGDFAGTLSAVIGGKPYADDVKGHGHPHDN
jgi:hypothetical protein